MTTPRESHEVALSAVFACAHAFQTAIEPLCEASYTCNEAEAIYAAIKAVGLADMAEGFMVAHAETDQLEAGDAHEVMNGGTASAWWRYFEEDEDA